MLNNFSLNNCLINNFSLVKFIIINLLFTSFIAYPQEISKKDNGTIRLEWEQVESADEYHLQIKNQNEKIIIDTKINKNYYELKLTEGNYYYRIGVYNKFKKISGYSDWEDLIIAKIFNPIFKDYNLRVSKSEIPKKIKVIGKNFVEDSKAELKGKNKNFILKFEYIDSENLNIELPDNLEIDQYSFILTNPLNKSGSIENFLEIYNENIKNEIVEKEILKPIISYPYWKEGMYSAIIPGWGQYNKKDFFKSTFFGISMITGGFLVHRQVNDFQNAKSNYTNTSNYGLMLPSYQGELALPFLLNQYIQSNRDYDVVIQKAQLVGNVTRGFLGLYILNIIDAIFWKNHSKDKDNSVQYYLNFDPIGTSLGNNKNYFQANEFQFGVNFKF
jgi:hypothetical protein